MSETSEFTLIISFLVFLGAISAGIYVPALPELGEIFGVLPIHMKLSITLYFVGAIGGSLVAGPLSMRYGKEGFIFIFLLVFILASFICAFSTTISSFLVGRFLQGAGIIGAPIISLAATADRYKGPLYRHMTALIIVLISVGTGVSHLIGVALVSLFKEWQAIFYFLSFIGGLALYFCYYTKIGEQNNPTPADYPYVIHRVVNRHKVFKYYQAMIGSLEGVLYAFIVISPYIFRMQYGWSMFEFSLVGIALAGAISVASFLNERLYPILGGKILVLLGIGFLTLSLIILLIFDRGLSALGIVLVMVLFVMGGHFIEGNLILKAMRVEPKFTTISSSLIIFSKIAACALALIFILVCPEDVRTVTYFIFAALIICSVGYVRIRNNFPSKH